MNRLLELKGKFTHSKNNIIAGGISLPAKAQLEPIKITHLEKLKNQLISIFDKWSEDNVINGALVTAYYREIIAKSNRLGRLLKESGVNKNDTIRGIKFNNTNPKKHIFTYFISLDALKKSIEELNDCISIAEENFGEEINKSNIDNIRNYNINFKSLSKSSFAQIIKDSFFVEDFGVEEDNKFAENTSIISLYKTGIDTKEFLRKIGITLIDEKMLDETTLRLMPNEIEILMEKAPYLIAMKTNDLSKLTKAEVFGIEDNVFSIPAPQNEPTIGVIDTLFDQNVYFNKWVEYEEMIDSNIPRTDDDYFHGTAVTSLIVDGANINPNLNDGCGRFRVKHFGVATGGRFSSFSVLKSIKIAVKENPHIKVWNLSLGSSLPINPNFVSPEAAELDKIQSEYDVVFVVAGTNKPKNCKDIMKIGAPADSINSIVVNSVDFKGNPASYHRKGPVLEFFYKPDISYYGGDKDKKIRVCSSCGEYSVAGTSFAAPYISRKMAYLINILGFSREVAKALLIDAAAGWERKDTGLCDIGYGVVPININDIVSSKDDEIKFTFTGATEEYETSAYNIPIPLNNDGKYPYCTRATLCYYPKCLRNQGVDYTENEIDFQFGRVKQKSIGKYELKALDRNTQGNSADRTKEKNARDNWRKWDNIKHIARFGKQSKTVKASYEGELCGIKMTVKSRNSSKHTTMPFGIVITLKEMNGVNRINDFIKRCNIKGWYVNQVDINNRIDIINKAEEELKFD